MRIRHQKNRPAKSGAPRLNRDAWVALHLQKRRRARAAALSTPEPEPAIFLSSDGHGHLTWTLNFVPPSDDSEPGIPYENINIYKSDDGVTWGNDPYDGWNLAAGSRDCSGDPGYFRICVSDWEGRDVPPYSNAVYSDGL